MPSCGGRLAWSAVAGTVHVILALQSRKHYWFYIGTHVSFLIGSLKILCVWSSFQIMDIYVQTQILYLKFCFLIV